MIAELACRGLMYKTLGESLPDVVVRGFRDYFRATTRHQVASKDPSVGKNISTTG